MDFLNADWARCTSFDDALVIFDGDELPFIVENGPVFLDEAIDLILHIYVKMRQIEELAQSGTMCQMQPSGTKLSNRKMLLYLMER